MVYWNTMEDVLIQYVKLSDNKFDYDNEGIVLRNTSMLIG